MEITNLKVYDLGESIIASGYPMSTSIDTTCVDKMNTYWLFNEDEEVIKHFKRAKGLGNTNGTSGHNQFLTGIRVAFDLKCTNKMWVELERYRFIEFVSSQSTMHRVTSLDVEEQCNNYVWMDTIDKLEFAITSYNKLADKTTDHAKELYLRILYNIPSGYELTARLTTNYRALQTVYNQRKNHRLPEWREFCSQLESLPFFKELCIDR